MAPCGLDTICLLERLTLTDPKLPHTVAYILEQLMNGSGKVWIAEYIHIIIFPFLSFYPTSSEPMNFFCSLLLSNLGSKHAHKTRCIPHNKIIFNLIHISELFFRRFSNVFITT